MEDRDQISKRENFYNNTKAHSLRCNSPINSTCMLATDTMDGLVKSLDGNKYSHVLSNETYFSEIYPMLKKSDAVQALKTFVMELGVPDKITVN